MNDHFDWMYLSLNIMMITFIDDFGLLTNDSSRILLIIYEM